MKVSSTIAYTMKLKRRARSSSDKATKMLQTVKTVMMSSLVKEKMQL